MSPKIGVCALCLTANCELQNSHVIPAWAYRRLRDRRPGSNPEPMHIQGTRVSQRSKQVHEPMLCKACEERFAGEDRYVATLACDHKGFEALRLAEQRSPLAQGVWIGNPGKLAPERLAYFALSVVWRAHVARTAEDCDLGPHAEPIRAYLLDRSQPFPARTIASLCILHDGEPNWRRLGDVVTLPQTQRKRASLDNSGPFYSHEFALCGLYFSVHTGGGAAVARTGLRGDPPIVGIVPYSQFFEWIAPLLADALPRK